MADDLEDDPIAEYRRKGSQLGPEKQTGSGAPEKKDGGAYGYAAFDLLSKGVGEFLSVVRQTGLVRCFSYNGLVEIAHDGEFGTQVALVFNFGPVVFIYGRNLSGLALGLCFRRIETITEFDASRWPELKDKSAAIIEKIDIVVKDMADAIAQVEQMPRKSR